MIGLAVLALLAFAANSVLARLALGSDRIDLRPSRRSGWRRARWCSGSCFEATGRHHSGTSISALDRRGAAFPVCRPLLIRLRESSDRDRRAGAVRSGAAHHDRRRAPWRRAPRPREWIGLLLAMMGLVYLNLPGIGAPDPAGVALMALAGWPGDSIRSGVALRAPAAADRRVSFSRCRSESCSRPSRCPRRTSACRGYGVPSRRAPSRPAVATRCGMPCCRA